MTIRTLLMTLLLCAVPGGASAQIADFSADVQRAIDSFSPPLRVPQCPQGDAQAEQFCPELVKADTDMKGTVTLRAAYFINQRDPNLGLLVKTGGANHLGFSADVLVSRITRQGVDIATTRDRGDGFREVVARWEVFPPDGNTSDPTRWAQPTRELAGLDGPDPTPTPTPPPTDNGDHDVIIDLMGDLQKQMADFRTWAEGEIAAVRAEHKAQQPSLDKTGTPLWQIIVGILGAIAGGVGATK